MFQGDTPHTATATVDITVQDKNDQPPIFTQHFITKIHENSPRSTFVIKITATDGDTGDNATPMYSLKVNPQDMFAIDSLTGAITVAGELDRETKDAYILQVATNDNTYGAQTEVSIDVLDTNDNAPTFDEVRYSFQLVEEQPGGAVVGTVTARDRDAPGPNSDIYYRLGTSSKLFRVDSDTGLVTSRVSLQYSSDGAISSTTTTSNVHSLTVLAVDRGEPPMASEVSVTIEVRPTNQYAPVFSEMQYMGYLAENAQVNDPIVQLMAR